MCVPNIILFLSVTHHAIYTAAGLRIEALEEVQKEEDESASDHATDTEGDEKFVVSDGELADQVSDFEVSTV